MTGERRDEHRASSPPESVESRSSVSGARSISRIPPLDADLVRDVPVVPESRLRRQSSIAMGGMGEVEEALDTSLGRPVAKKTLHIDLQTESRHQRMLVREARVTGQLEHPNIVPVHDLGVDSDGRLFFTMKKVEGRTLKQLVDSLPAGPFEHATLLNLLEIVIKVCDALALAHARGVVHCDLKAGNVMVGDFGEVYLMDWGVARLLGADGAREGYVPVDDGLGPLDEAGDGSISGTPSHMAPEQAKSEDHLIGPRTDVFAVGALLYEIVTGHPPYEGEIVWALLLKAAMRELEPITDSERGRALAPMLAGIIDRAMRADPDERHPTVGVIRDELVRFVRGDVDFPRARFEAGQAIVLEGEKGDAVFTILEGECEVFRGPPDDRQFVRSMGPGATFGEMAILSPGPRTATVIAKTDVVAEVVTAEIFARELATMKPWLAAVVRNLADRFRERGL